MDNNLDNCVFDIQNAIQTQEEIEEEDDQKRRREEIENLLNCEMEDFKFDDQSTINTDSTSPHELDLKEEILNLEDEDKNLLLTKIQNKIELHTRLDDADDKINILQEEIKKLKDENYDYRKMNDNLREKFNYVNQAVTEVANLQLNIQTVTARANLLENKNMELQRTIEILRKRKEISTINKNESMSVYQHPEDYVLNQAKNKIKQLSSALNAKQDLLQQKENEIRKLKLKNKQVQEKPYEKKLTKHEFIQVDIVWKPKNESQYRTHLEDAEKEIALLKEKVSETEFAKYEIAEQLTKTKAELEEMEDKFSEAVERIGNMRTEIAANDVIIDKKNDLLEEMRKTLEEAEDEVQIAHEKISQLTQELGEKCHQLLELKEEVEGIAQIKTQLEESLVEVTRLTTKIYSAEYLQKCLESQVQVTGSEAESNRKRADNIQVYLENLDHKIINIENLHESLKEQIANSDLTINLAYAEMSDFQEKLVEMRHGIAQMDEKLEDYNEASQVVNGMGDRKQLSATDMQLVEMKHKISDSSIDMELVDISSTELILKMQNELIQAKERITDLTKKLTRSETDRGSLVVKLNQAEVQIRNCYAEIETLNITVIEERDSEKNVNVSQSFEKFQDEIVSSKSRIKRLQNKLKEARLEIRRLRSKLNPQIEKYTQCENEMNTSGIEMESNDNNEEEFEARLETEILRREIHFREAIQKEFHAKLQNVEIKYKTAASATTKQQEEAISFLLEQQQLDRDHLASMLEEWSSNVQELEKQNEELIKALELAKKEIEKKRKMSQGSEEELVDLAKMMEKETEQTVAMWKKCTASIVRKFCDGFSSVTKMQKKILKSIEEAENEIDVIHQQFLTKKSTEKNNC